MTAIYDLFAEAIRSRRQILCRYDGYARELCPHILGESKGHAVALAFQFAGQSRSGLPKGGEWRCLWLDRVSEARLRDGPWHSGALHGQAQSCVESVDLDVNPQSPYAPRRR
ncbi:MAG: hypothetical protein AB1508_06805 [Pseudomonadota bacterium]